jgi:hypothetical protein
MPNMVMTGGRKNTADEHWTYALNTKQHLKQMESQTCLLLMSMTAQGVQLSQGLLRFCAFFYVYGEEGASFD